VDKIEFLANVLKKMKHEWDFKKINYTIPSIKIVHKASGIKCDISMTNGLAVHNSHLLSHLFDLQPEAVAFYLYLKRWLRLFDVRFKVWSIGNIFGS
jgi:DNA polymerase sigma